MKRFWLYTIVGVLLSSDAGAQSLSVFNMDRSALPSVHAYISVVDKDGRRIGGLTANDFIITENGKNCPVTLYTCPPETPTNKISAAISVDISGSMGQQFNGASSIDYAKMTCTNLLNALPMPPTEVALQQCDDRADILQDFTTDRARVLSKITPLKAGGGNDFVEHLLNERTGLLTIAAQGKYQRNAILCSDAYWYPLPPDEFQRSLDICAREKIRFYAILFNDQQSNGGGVRESLQRLADATGGWLREGVITQDAANQIANELTGELGGSPPCEIVWEAPNICNDEITIDISVPRYNLSTTITFENPLAKGYVITSPSSLRFGRVTPPLSGIRTVRLYARNGDVLVNSLATTHPAISIQSISTPFFITRDNYQDITLIYTPLDTTFISAQLLIGTDACDDSLGTGFPISAGVRPQRNLTMLKPSAGHTYVVGEDTVIEWTGVDAADPVKLEYSTDGGVTYSTITDSAFGLQYKWRVPFPTSTRCRIRGSLVTSALPQDLEPVLVNRYRVFDTLGVAPTYAEISPNNKQIMVSARGVHLFDATSALLQYSYALTQTTAQVTPTYLKNGAEVIGVGGSTIFSLRAAGGPLGVLWTKTSSPLTSLTISPNQALIATTSQNGATEIRQSSDGALVQQLWGHLGDATASAFDGASGRLVTVGTDMTARIWDVATGMELQSPPITLPGTGSATAFHPNDQDIITTTQTGMLERWSLPASGQVSSRQLSMASPSRLSLNRTGSLLFVASSANMSGKMLSESSGAYTDAFTTNDAFLNWNARPPMTKSGQLLIFRKSGSPTTASIWDMTTSRIAGELPHPSLPRSATFSEDERYIVTTTDREAFLWEISNSPDTGRKVDTTSLFSVVAPQCASVDIDMGMVLVGAKKDSVITNYITNTGTYKVRIDSVTIAGANAGDFFLQSAPPQVLDPGTSAAVEFAFLPSAPGARSAGIKIHTRSGELQQAVIGTGVNKSIQTLGNVVDFGVHPVGEIYDSTLTVAVTNVGTASIDITAAGLLGPDIDQFSIVSGGGSFVLAPSESRSMVLRFSPQYIGRASSNIGFTYVGIGSPAVLRLYGQGIGGTVYIPDDSGAAGHVVEIPILLKGAKKYIQDGSATKFTAKISFDASVLTPVDAQARGTIQNGTQMISLADTWSGASDTLAVVAMQVGLGAREQTTIDIPVFTWLDDFDVEVPLAIEVLPGTFKLVGLCEDGGKRLFNPTGEVRLTVQPNPSTERRISIRYETIEDGPTSLKIYSPLGSLIKEISSSQAGTYDNEFNQLATGSYYCILQTPSIQLKRIFFVAK